MPDTTAAQGRIAAERLRRMIEDSPFVDQSEPVGSSKALSVAAPRIRVTLSIGVAVGGPGNQPCEDIDMLFNRADAALYSAKSAGRNMVTVSQSAA